ncbi:MAG: hypothetical protein ACR2H3_08570 [Acidimicrobiales bacterium]
MVIAGSALIVAGEAVPYHKRPTDDTPLHTADLPDLPTRDRNIPATAWVEAPEALLSLGQDFGGPVADYKRQIHGWLLWRSGPATKANAAYAAIAADDLSVILTFRLRPDGSGDGIGPSGESHTRFRAWKEDLRDHPRS